MTAELDGDQDIARHNFGPACAICNSMNLKLHDNVSNPKVAKISILKQASLPTPKLTVSAMAIRQEEEINNKHLHINRNPKRLL